MGWVEIGLVVTFCAAVWGFVRFQQSAGGAAREPERYPELSSSRNDESRAVVSRRAAHRADLFNKYRRTASDPVDRMADDNEYSMSYADADGIVTERTISILNIHMNSSALYIRAMCHLRESERTFRADRVMDCRHLASGRVIPDPEIHFAEALPLAERPDPAHDSVMARVRPGLTALVWIARADRDVSADEMEILLSYIGERSTIGGTRFAAAAWDRAKAVAQIDEMRPTLASALAGARE